MITRWFTSIRIFLVWLLGFALALIIMALGHELIMTFLANSLHSGRYFVRLVYVVYYTIAGLLCVAYYIFINDFLNASARKGKLLERSLLIIGIQLLIIGLLQVCLLLYGYFPNDLFIFFIVIIEAASGAVMLFFSMRKKQSSNVNLS